MDERKVFRMKKVLAILLILVLVFTVGCGGKRGVPVAPTEKVPAETTSAAVTEIESDLAEIDDLDEDFVSTETDSLDKDLDFQI